MAAPPICGAATPKYKTGWSLLPPVSHRHARWRSLCSRRAGVGGAWAGRTVPACQRWRGCGAGQHPRRAAAAARRRLLPPGGPTACCMMLRIWALPARPLCPAGLPPPRPVCRPALAGRGRLQCCGPAVVGPGPGLPGLALCLGRGVPVLGPAAGLLPGRLHLLVLRGHGRLGRHPRPRHAGPGRMHGALVAVQAA